jgi:hypothetical protein
MLHERRMNFEAAQKAREHYAEFDRLIAEKLDELDAENDWSIEKMASAVNYAAETLDPGHGELKYEMDEGEPGRGDEYV